MMDPVNSAAVFAAVMEWSEGGPTPDKGDVAMLMESLASMAGVLEPAPVSALEPQNIYEFKTAAQLKGVPSVH